MRNVVCTERDNVGRRTAELTHEHVLVLLGYLFGHGFRRVVQLGEGILGSLISRYALGGEIVVDVLAERFGNREEHATVGNGISFHIVEVAVGVCLVVIVQSVGSEHLDKGLVLHLRLWYIRKVYASRVALELHVQTELLLLHRRGKVVDVLHHKSPVALARIVRRVLERLHEERLAHVRVV